MSGDSLQSRIKTAAEQLPVSISEEQIQNLFNTIQSDEDLISKLEELQIQEEPPDREYWKPKPEEDPNGAFIHCCSIEKDDTGILDTLSIGIKDNIAVAGVPMTAGSPILKDYIPREDATVVNRLLEEGSNVVGKTNMDEFAMGRGKESMRFRLAKNPNNNKYQPGGSSSGSGIAVAEEQVDAALGTDTGGSIRFPAAWCGVIGIKPTRGLVSQDGILQYSRTLDSVGVLSNDISTTAKVLETIAGTDPNDNFTEKSKVESYHDVVNNSHPEDLNGLKIGTATEFFNSSGNVTRITESCLNEFKNAGATIKEVSISGFEYALPAWRVIATTEFAAYMDARANNYWTLSESDPKLNRILHKQFGNKTSQIGDPVLVPWVFGKYLNNQYGDEPFSLAQRGRKRVTSGINQALKKVDVLMSPTVPRPPMRWGENIDDITQLVGNTAPFNLSGHPAITIPSGSVEGLPVGLQIIGSHFSESKLFRVASAWKDIDTR